MIKYRYNVINKNGVEEPWSGIFDTMELSDAWYQKHGKFHEDRGHTLVLAEVSSDSKEYDEY